MKQILIVDDDVSIGNMLEEILTKEGYGVRRAYSGTKPFDTKELLARIVVQFRNASKKPDTGIMEYAILKLLMQNPTQVITKSLMLDRISEDTPDCMESSLNVHISNLRKKLRDVDGRDYIETVWGIGFKMKDE